MLVYPAASELNTQPVHKILFINALPAHARVRTLSSLLSLINGRNFVSRFFSFTFHLTCRSCTSQMRCVSSHSLTLFFFNLSTFNTIQFAIFCSIMISLPRELLWNVSRLFLFRLHLNRFAHLSVHHFDLDVILFFLSLYPLACVVCVSPFVFLFRQLNVSPCSCAL